MGNMPVARERQYDAVVLSAILKKRPGESSSVLFTCSMLGFSKGGLPRDPSTTGWLICRMHFLSS